MSSANETQVGGGHYKTQTPDQPQHWDIVAIHNLDYFQGQITKYVMRWKNKNGLQDLQKAQHFLQKYIELNSPAIISTAGMNGTSFGVPPPPQPLPRPQFLMDDDQKQRMYDMARSEAK